jgi:hypothetical protein
MEQTKSPKESKGNIRHEKRRIIAEDPEWNLAPVQRLTNKCVDIIVKNFESEYLRSHYRKSSSKLHTY